MFQYRSIQLLSQYWSPSVLGLRHKGFFGTKLLEIKSQTLLKYLVLRYLLLWNGIKKTVSNIIYTERWIQIELRVRRFDTPVNDSLWWYIQNKEVKYFRVRVIEYTTDSLSVTRYLRITYLLIYLLFSLWVLNVLLDQIMKCKILYVLTWTLITHTHKKKNSFGILDTPFVQQD